MKLSIIIVNYNVSHFLEQCLLSVNKATENISAEVFVVDNNSPDDSVEMVKAKFPEVLLIDNQENVGFSTANNQAIALSKGEYVLLLNPDTVVEEDTFMNCIEFMDAHPDGGGLGVKMIDGSGKFLPESKRGLPTPSVSFYKIFGLSRLFPTSKKFSKYHLGYLNENETNEIEVLSGAFMWMRKSVLDQVGYLDETFFMYGEDIDLSYRIILGGYKNYYLPKVKIIHYKGESTKKGNLKYVFVFYNAMIIFSKKHFAKKAKAFSFFINIAIYLRAFLAVLTRFAEKIRLPLTDITLITAVLVTSNFVKPYFGFPNRIIFSDLYNIINVVSVFVSFLFGIAISGGYSKSLSINKTLLGVSLGSIFLYCSNLALPEATSFSMKYLLSIMALILTVIPINRIILDYYETIKLRRKSIKTTLISGSLNFINLIKEDINQNNTGVKTIAVKANNLFEKKDCGIYTGKLYQLPDLISIYNINEVIFSSKDISYKDIICKMNLSDTKHVDYKISLNSDLIIGSNSIDNIT
jgi:GT2 family glycosyltransferase